MFLLEGVLTELNVELGRQNLLASIDARYRDKAAATGVAAGAGDLFGQAASSAALTMYDGEDTQNFMCLIDGQPMCGQFGGAEWLKPGNRVKAVVTKHENVLCAHAIMDEHTGLLWITHPWGAKAEVATNWKIAWWCYLFQLLFITLGSVWLGGWDTKTFEMLKISAIGGAALCFGMAFWTSRTMRSLADPSTEMFRLLGFADPASVNLNSYQESIVGRKTMRATQTSQAEEGPWTLGMAEFRRRDVHNYKRAIEDGKVALLAAPH
jgi:phosphate/sulfate permease